MLKRFSRSRSNPAPPVAPPRALPPPVSFPSYPVRRPLGPPSFSGTPQRSGLPAELRRLVELGLPSAPFPPLPLYLSGKRFHGASDCPGAKGASPVSLSPLEVTDACVCFDEVVEDAASASGVLEAARQLAESADQVASAAKSLSSRSDPADPFGVIQDLEYLADFLDPAGFDPEVSSILERVDAERRAVLARAARLLVRGQRDRVRELLVEAVVFGAYDSELSDAEHLLLGGYEGWDGDSLVSSMVSSWEGSAASDLPGARVAALEAGLAEVSEDLDPESLAFVPYRLPAKGELVSSWLADVLSSERRSVLERLVSAWETTLKEALGGGGDVLAVPVTFLRSDFSEDVSVLLEHFRVASSEAFRFPALFLRWFEDEHGLSCDGSNLDTARLLPTDSPLVVETALGIFDSASGGALERLEAALQAARILEPPRPGPAA